MIARLGRRAAGLWRRFADAQAVEAGRTGALGAAGRLTLLERGPAGLRAEGWIDADRIALEAGGARAEARREDGAERLRFALRLPDADGPARLVWPGGARALRFPGPRARRALLMADFAGRLVRLAPAFAGHLRTGDPRHRGTVKRVLGLDRGDRFGPLGAWPPAPAGALPAPAAPATIVLPVYDGFDLLAEVLDRVRANTADHPWRLVLIEDASPDPRVRPFLRGWAEAAQGAGHAVRLIEPEANLGFIGAVNAGLEAAEADGAGGPVVLLNADALVPPGWLPRLLAPLADPSVASVTPMSNDSEVTSVPALCARLDLAPGAADALDAVARGWDPVATAAEMPTGVGFCMALSPAFLARVPRLDTVFGRGYGEEVDWCQRTRRLGGRHVGSPALVVEHRGGVSFGSEAKRALIARNNAVIADRYPTYDLEVQRFIAADPLRGPRLALALHWASGRGPLPVYLAHSLGGGAEIWLGRRIEADLARGRPSAVLRTGGAQRWQLELHAPSGTTGATTEDLEAVRALLDLPGRLELVYSCGADDPDPAALPEVLLSLRRPGDGLEVLLHDWLPVSPSYTLLDADGAWRGVPLPGREDRAHRARRPSGGRMGLGDWQAAWGRLMAEADRVVVFSPDGRDLLGAVWPGLDVAVEPHAMPDLSALAMEAPAGSALGVLGNLNDHKGAGVVAALSRAGTEVAVLGAVDPGFPMPRRVRVHGGYEDLSDIPGLARRYGIGAWVVPAIWPETFSFATREALATGLPVIGFDLGGQGAALREAANGTALAMPDPALPRAAREAAMARAVTEARAEDRVPSSRRGRSGG